MLTHPQEKGYNLQYDIIEREPVARKDIYTTSNCGLIQGRLLLSSLALTSPHNYTRCNLAELSSEFFSDVKMLDRLPE